MLEKRREELLKKLNPNSAVLLFSGAEVKSSADANYPFVVNNNFFYLTNIDQANVALLIVKGKVQTDTFLFLDETDETIAKWVGYSLSKDEASKLANVKISNIFPYNALDGFISTLVISSRRNKFGVINDIYFDLERNSFNDIETISEKMAKKIKDAYPYVDIHDCYDFIADQRRYKDDDEINKIKTAIKITKDGINRLMKHSKEDMYEYNYVAEYNYVLDNNNVKPSFETIAASADNAVILHYVKNDAMVKNNDLILFDLGVKYDHYCSDISRTFPVNGKFTKRQKEIYSIVLEANKKTISWLKPGVTFQEFLDYGKKILIEGLKKLGLIKEDSEISKYYYHGLGHYLGLDVHDVGDYTEPFKEGIVITVEPGLYIAEEGIGIRIEDDVLITKDGAINLSESIIKEIDDIENFMKK